MSTISASTTTTTAYVVTADTTGALVLQTGASPTTAVTIGTSQQVTCVNSLQANAGLIGITTTAGGYGVRAQADSANTYSGIQFTNYAGTTDWSYIRSYLQNTLSFLASAGGSGISVGIGTASPSSSYSLDTTGTIRSQADVYAGFVNGTSGGVWLAKNNYTYPAVQALTSAGNANNLLLNPAGGAVGLVGTSVIRSVTFNTSEMAMATSTLGCYLNLCDASGNNGANYTFNIRGLASGGSAQATLSAINLVASAVSITGSLSKGSGSFRIDHPLPQLEATHHLVHSFIEGPQADLIYRGKVSLINGTATVNIDTSATMTEGTFVALCRNVQCFTTNESDWTAVRGSVVGNILTIEAQDQTSTASISWMVIGERQDKHMHDTNWTDENGRVIVEPLKPEPQEGDLPFEGA